MSAIGNCPWCNHRAVLFSNPAREVTFVRCNNQLCGAQGPEMSTRDLAIASWNRLATPGQAEVRGRVRWEGVPSAPVGECLSRAFLGRVRVGGVWRLPGGQYWRAASNLDIMSNIQLFDTEAAARAALETAVMEAIKDE